MATVLDLSQAPGVMTGYGLISAEHVRGLLPSADLRAINVDELSGRPISVGALLRAGWDPRTGRLLPDPTQTPTEASKPPPTKRSRKHTEGLAAPSADPPQDTFWPSPAPSSQDSETPVTRAQGSDAVQRSADMHSPDLHSSDLHSTESVDIEPTVTEATTSDSADVELKVTAPEPTMPANIDLKSAEPKVPEPKVPEPMVPEPMVPEPMVPEPASNELIDSDLDGERRRNPDQIREALLSMITPVWAVDRAEPQHDPSAALSRLVDLRDQRCCGPGCSLSVGRTQRDHNVRWPDGPTAAWNLSVKSARCHRAKHAGWQVTIDDAGDAHWVSPLGRAYDRPGVWETPPDLSAVRTLPTPRAPQSLSYKENLAGEVTGLTPYSLPGSTSSGQVTQTSQDQQAGDDRAKQDHPGDNAPPPF